MSAANDGSNDYEVEAIITHRTTRQGKIEYFVKWKDYDSDENSFVEEHLMYSPDIQREYWKRVAEKKEREKNEPPKEEPPKKQKKKRKRPLSYWERRQKQAEFKRCMRNNEKLPSSSPSIASSSKSNSHDTTPEPENPKPQSPEKTVAPPPPPKARVKLIPPPLPKRVSKVVPEPTTSASVASVQNEEQKEEMSACSSSSAAPAPAVKLNTDNVTIRRDRTRSRDVTPAIEEESRSSSKSSTPFDIAGMEMETETEKAADVEKAVEPVAELSDMLDKCGIDRGLQIKRILTILLKDNTAYCLVQYEDWDCLEWIDKELVKEADENALIQYYEMISRDDMGV